MSIDCRHSSQVAHSHSRTEMALKTTKVRTAIVSTTAAAAGRQAPALRGKSLPRRETISDRATNKPPKHPHDSAANF
jgi:hypothetical protein